MTYRYISIPLSAPQHHNYAYRFIHSIDGMTGNLGNLVAMETKFKDFIIRQYTTTFVKSCHIFIS